MEGRHTTPELAYWQSSVQQDWFEGSQSAPLCSLQSEVQQSDWPDSPGSHSSPGSMMPVPSQLRGTTGGNEHTVAALLNGQSGAISWNVETRGVQAIGDLGADVADGAG